MYRCDNKFRYQLINPIAVAVSNVDSSCMLPQTFNVLIAKYISHTSVKLAKREEYKSSYVSTSLAKPRKKKCSNLCYKERTYPQLWKIPRKKINQQKFAK